MGLFSKTPKDEKSLEKAMFNTAMTFFMRKDPSHLAPDIRAMRARMDPADFTRVMDDFWARNWRMLSEEWAGADLNALRHQVDHWVLSC